MWITAGIYALAALPVFFVLRERAQPSANAVNSNSPGVFQGLRASWTMSAQYPDFRQFMLCGVFYQAGIAVVITLAAIYAEQAMKFSQEQTMALIFVVNIAATIGAFLFGYLQDRVGHQRALAMTLVGWLWMIAMAGLSTSPTVFWMAATMAGLCMGSSQSCGRALVGTFAPVKQSAEFFGLWTFATRLASIIGPIAYGVVTTLTEGNHRLAILTTGIFFVIGLIVLRRVNVERGQACARQYLAV
jgi:MFS transporter, UMF1 family